MPLEKIQNTAPKVPELVMSALLCAMERGEIKLNEEVPAERELALTLGVGRGSLRESLAVLAFLGVITSRGNRKVVVKDADYIQKAIAFLNLSEQTDTLLNDSISFRETNEVAIVQLACVHANPTDIQAMAEAVRRLEENPADHLADVEFHTALARASHNVMLAVVIDLVNSMIMDLRVRFMAVPEYHQKTLSAHHDIYLAVLEGDKFKRPIPCKGTLKILRPLLQTKIAAYN